MGFFSFLFGNNQKKESSKISRIQNTKRKGADAHFYYQLIDTIVVSENAGNKLKQQVKKAFEEPVSFYDDHGEYTLAGRGMRFSKDAVETTKFVFIDTLIEEEQMAEVDWKEEEAEIREEIIIIMKAKQFSFLISDEDLYENMRTADIFKHIDDEELTPNGYSLQFLDIQSDSYVFTIVPLQDSNKVKEMFAAL